LAGVNEAGFNTTSFFDVYGNALPTVDAVGGMAAPLLLQAGVQGSNLVLQWPFSGAAAQLMVSSDLSSRVGWQLVTQPVGVQTSVANFSANLPISDHVAFYRLQASQR
jgi:hypothetical protein